MTSLGPVATLLVGLILPVWIVSVVCEGILFLDPKVERRSPFLPYLLSAREPLSPDRARVRRWGVRAGLVALLLAGSLLLIDLNG